MRKVVILSAIRSLVKYRNINIINILGLVLGMTSFLLILNYLLYEFSYDNYVPGSENVYRVNLSIEKNGQQIYKGAKTPRALYFGLKNNIPQIEENGIAYFEKCLVNYQNITYANQDVLWVDEGFEKVFPIKMILGVADYSKPRTGTISETMAKTFFGNKNPVGKILRINQGMPIEVTGVFKDLPSNTHLNAQYFASIKTWVEMGAINELGDWQWNGWWNYIRVKNGTKPLEVTNEINRYTAPHMDFLKQDNRNYHYSMQALNDLHFISGLEGEMGAQTNRSSLYNLIAIIVVLLLIVWINYVNLAAAHAQARSLPIKIRKLVGASNMHLWFQALTESILLNVVALVISLAIYFIFVNTFARIFSIPIHDAFLAKRILFIVFLVTMGLGILLTSIYNSISLSGISFLQKPFHTGRRTCKNSLIIVQMALSMAFLACTLLVYKQIQYMKNKNLGIELNDVVVCTGPASLNADGKKREHFESFKQELLKYPDFTAATFNRYTPGQEPRTGYREFTNPAAGATSDVMFFENNAGTGFIDTYKMHLVAGRDFDENPQQNINRIIINETALKDLKFENSEQAIGKMVYRKNNPDSPLEIIGVVTDFHNEGLQKPIYPIVWNNQYPSEFGYFAVRINTKNSRIALDKLNQIWDKHYPNDNFNFVFANQQFNLQYLSESRFGKFFLWLTLLSIGIAAMGLYGLVLFTFEQRNKEIGIRKVNGASLVEILKMLNAGFVKWVGIAFVLATPVAYYLVNKWLQNFAYKTNLSWWIFILSGFITFTIVIVTVSWQSLQAARRNPVEVLRYE